MSAPAHRDPLVVERSRETLEGMRADTRSLVYAAIVTDDGFEVVHVPAARLGEESDGRMASMASSIQALGEAVALELAIGAGQYVILAAEAGFVIQMRVPGHPLVLATHFASGETLGTALAAARLVAERLGAAIPVAPVEPRPL